MDPDPKRQCVVVFTAAVFYKDCVHGAHNHRAPIDDFLPSGFYAKKRKEMEELLNAFKAGGEKKEMEKIKEKILSLSTGRCISCRNRAKKSQQNPSTVYGSCREEWFRIKAELGPCVDCGYAGPAIEADHVEKSTKVRQLSDYPWWAWNGGVDAMREEAKKVVARCRCCHTIQPTSHTGNVVDPSTIPDVRCSVDTKAYKKKKKASINFPKYQFVNAEKVSRGECQMCKKKVDASSPFHSNKFSASPVCFDFNHIDETKKWKNPYKGSTGGVSGICANLSIRLEKTIALREGPDGFTGEDLLTNEMRLCNLLCRNCHHVHTHKY